MSHSFTRFRSNFAASRASDASSGGFTPLKAAQDLKDFEELTRGKHACDAMEERAAITKLLHALKMIIATIGGATAALSEINCERKPGLGRWAC